MRKLATPRVIVGAASVLLVAAVLVVSFAIHGTAGAAALPYNSHPISVNPQRVPAGTPNGHVFGCQTQLVVGGIVCYSPEQLQNAYNITPLLKAGITGAGKTIVIIDAYQNPAMQEDLVNFDTAFGLPAPNFTQIAPDGLTPFDPNDANQVGWAGEITLDVQWAHAVAPGANITLVLAKSNQDADILSATKYAVDHRVGDIITQSFGENEKCVDPKLLKDEHAIFANATRKHMTICASSGDQGAAQQTCDGNSWVQVASSPASDPFVTGVGGTELIASPACRDAALNEIPCASGIPAGTYQSETALNEAPGLFTDGSFSTGGGFSTVYHEPFYQFGNVNHHFQRGVPDVAYNGAIGHGVLASFTVGGGFFIFGGTSAGSPQWAGITALADQKAGHSLGFLNSTLYKISFFSSLYKADFHDVTSGNNSVQEFDATNTLVSVPGFNAGKGWDATTGLGTPNVANLLKLIPAYHSDNDDNDAANKMDK
ncbi:MAG: S53 family peptidase [Ktedonobacterales bacterium]|nr:S53 family peptidase [Ktedonobacterales bacterium]